MKMLLNDEALRDSTGNTSLLPLTNTKQHQINVAALILFQKVLPFSDIANATQSSTWKMPLRHTGQSAFSLISHGSMHSLWKE